MEFDADFDSYWDYEAKNKNRNRIRVGRQYQASIPPLLKPDEIDERNCDDLETLKWKPDKLSDQEVEQYLSMAKGVSLFAKAIDNSRISETLDISLQSAIKGLSEFVASHHPCHHDDGCQVPKSISSEESASKISLTNDWSPSEAQLFAQALEACGKNFCAIKKDFLPWKPVRSIIEYYYQGRCEKAETNSQDSVHLVEKKENDPIACCSYDQQPLQIESSSEDKLNNTLNEEYPSKDNIPLIENSTASDCNSLLDLKMSLSAEESASSSSTLGSLKFFLGGRLVLKLNAQQDSSSGTKYQWVQSNDLPKHSSISKKCKHKKKFSNDESLLSISETPSLKKKFDELSPYPNNISESELVILKKPKLKVEYEFSEGDEQGSLLCSSSWTPPVAEEQESVEIDDCSSKTSEGYISPVRSNSRCQKTDIKSDINNYPNFLNEINDVKCDPDKEWNHLDTCGSSTHSENNYIDDSASKNIYFIGGKNSPNHYIEEPSYGQEVLNHKSALSHNKHCVKSPCCLSRTSHSTSPLLKQWNKWSTLPYMEKIKASPSSPSQASISPLKDNPLDLSSKLNNSLDNHDNYELPLALNKIKVKNEILNTSPPVKENLQYVSEYSPKSSSNASVSQNHDSSKIEIKYELQNSPKQENGQSRNTNIKKENCAFSPTENSEKMNRHTYPYCNPSCHYALTKCTKDYSLEDHLCNKNDETKIQGTNPDFIIQDVEESVYKKSSSWCSNSLSSYLQFYPHLPYYLSYSTTPSPVNEPSITEVPLDLSSRENKEQKKISENYKEHHNNISSNNAEALEKGMLYQLLKNKTTK